jgi:ferredoxin
LAAAKIGDGGFADVSLPGVPNRKRSVLPPGAVKRASFLHKCLGCGLCIGVCPGQCLKQSFKFGSFGQVELDFTEGYCRINCDSKCARVCPSGAIELLGDVERKDIHMGHALFKKDLCVRVTNGDPCTACERKCPVKAIKIVAGFPVVDKSACIGCGACEHVCPARPMPAIFVSGFENQRVVTKMGETDLIKEMALLVDRGDASAVVAKNGVIVAIEKGSGVRPLMALFEEGVLEGAIVADKVIGRAAAAILAAGKVKTLYASLLSDDALDILESAGIKWTAGERTSKILNRAKTGCCPFEDMVKGKTDPTEIVEIVRKALNK